MFKFFAAILVASFLVGCGDKAEFGSGGNVKPRKKIDDSFSIEKPIAPSSDKARLIIRKDALDREFLLQAQIVEQGAAARFNGLRSRIVAFTKRGTHILLLEATQGHVISNDAPQALVLAKFPILDESETAVAFDFDTGMAQVYAAADWVATDFDGAGYDDVGNFLSVALQNSYLEDAYFSATNRLVVRQRGVLRIEPLGLGQINKPVETIYYLSPYAPNETYSPVSAADFVRVGFFEVAPKYTTAGGINTFATRFDPSTEKTITYAISANTPAPYREAVREGVLYWNRAFGFEKLRVVDAPADLTAPNVDYNIVQWVNWDSAGSAYADAQMDPRTGEILHAQVFMTSAFDFGGRQKARRMLRRMEGGHESRIALSIAGARPSSLCNRTEHEALHQLLADLVISDLTEEQIQEIAKDYIREVVAHEIGHTLGLRHNFAGSLGSNASPEKTHQLFKRYARSSEVEAGYIPTSSVMEYQEFRPSVMSGRMIKNGNPAFSYDQYAIKVLYRGENERVQGAPLFCTDSHLIAGYLGCEQWDIGPSVIDNANHTEKETLQHYPEMLLERFIAAKTPAFGSKPIPFKELRLDPKTAAKGIYQNRAKILAYLEKETREITVVRSFNKVDATNEADVIAKQVQVAVRDIEKLGGMAKVLAPPSASLADNWKASFEQLIRSDAYRTGIGYDGKTYTLSEEEIATAVEIANDYFTRVQSQLTLAELNSLNAAGTLVDHPITEEYAQLLLGRAFDLLMSESGEVLEEKMNLGEGKSGLVRLPVFKYDLETRKTAAGLFMGKKSEDQTWGLTQHFELKSAFDTKMKTVLLDNELLGVSPEKNSRRAAKWLLENQALEMKMSQR